MLLGILTMITALAISAVAIYYSVAGLMTIFAAAAIPIMIMGGALEIGKLVTAVWLHKYWSRATWWLKTYLTTAVLVLMFITSMGIFGFLSKAHIEQTASAQEGIAQLERIDAEITRNEQVIVRAETKIEELETSGTGATAQIQNQIDREQERIEGAYARIQPAINEQNTIIADVTQLFQTELGRIDEELARLQGFIDSGDIRRAQQMVGARADGAFGPNTAAAFQEFQNRKAQEREQWLQRIQDAQQNDVVVAAREEIRRLRTSAEEQIAQSNALINNLRQQLKSNEGNDLQTLLDEQQDRVRRASSEIDILIDQKFQLEAEYRKLEAEVGPVKYIAEFIYGETANKNLLEEAVRWVIIVIIFVFDPLAVLLLIASQYTFNWHREGKDYVTGEKEDSDDTTAEGDRDRPITGEYTENTQSVLPEQTDDTQQNEKEIEHDLSMEETNTFADETLRDMVPEDNVSVDDGTSQSVEQTKVQSHGLSAEEVAKGYAELAPNPVEKKDLESSEESKQARAQELEAQDNDITWSEAKRSWKDAHPDETLKEHKEKFINGEIDVLPWEDYIVDESKKKNYIMKQGSQQIRKTLE